MVLVVGFACLVLLGMPYVPLARRFILLAWPWREFIKTTVLGIPLVALSYPPYLLLCVLLSLEALRRPATTGRMMGEAARSRARPWLAAASLLLLLVGLLVAVVIVWTVKNTRVTAGYYLLTGHALAVIGTFDLVISLLLAGGSKLNSGLMFRHMAASPATT